MPKHTKKRSTIKRKHRRMKQHGQLLKQLSRAPNRVSAPVINQFMDILTIHSGIWAQ
ncbi:hypothetical protein [Lactiplantibacillus plantarum]|uniref:hypothetical protein n=1 Tax=Lactiplantibacillus plantarum TaxID=1590 RepID=UPI0012AC766A|nr:hypothetical protein [Lactiplantibacillus plantarum]MCB7465293.1 hypothetical protein [Lactiplantibacillus plantarum]MCB7468590.1 hypothetical protein [Lactiplantibacillus plantarum]MCB7472742.1 hypothetical protein [Lactiplantibacillus plantarum]MCB7475174.1 hypothetical protein [Lactiplantibacillus plantarum]MCB7478775.1 hypothetical protein [Lactiplantibacillus plantarum]